MSVEDQRFMEEAVAEARAGLAEGGIPIGAVLVVDGNIIGRGRNQRVQRGSVVLHGEMDCLENAGRQKASVYKRACLYTTLWPCSMCTGTVLLYGIRRVVVGEATTFGGDDHVLTAAGVEVVLLNSRACIQMMEQFIADNPALWNEDIGEEGPGE